MTGSVAVTVDPVLTPSVNIVTSTGDDTSCVGVPTTFTAVPTDGGTSPNYQWSVAGIPTVISNPYTYIASDGDVVSVTMTVDEACATSSVVSKAIKISAIPYQTPTANIAVSPGDNVCSGTPVTLAGTTEFSGKAPRLVWLKNSVPVASGPNYSFTSGTVNNGDVLILMMMSDYRCRAAHSDTIFSNTIVMTVDSAELPVFTITSHLGPKIGVGQIDTFSATVTNGGSAPLTYQWQINGSDVNGATSKLYINYNVFNNDVISCVVTRNGACGGQTASHSFTVVQLVNVGVSQVNAGAGDINVLPNPNKGSFTVKGTLGTVADEDVSLEITDMLGQVVYKSSVIARSGNIDEKIQLNSSIANGMYLLSLHSASANNVFHIVIEQ